MMRAYARKDFNPRSPCGERPSSVWEIRVARSFQSTLPVWGATTRFSVGACWRRFQSTLPVWGATQDHPGKVGLDGISIHAPRVGSDGQFAEAVNRKPISIHAPRVGSDWCPYSTGHYQSNFNPRSPCGERPTRRRSFPAGLPISIHAPRVGSDVVLHHLHRAHVISIHAPRVGSDCSRRAWSAAEPKISIHAPRVGSDHDRICWHVGHR